MPRLRTWAGKNKLAALGLGTIGIVLVCCVCLYLFSVISPPQAANPTPAPTSALQRATARPTSPVATLDVMATATLFAQQVEQTQTAEALPTPTAAPPLATRVVPTVQTSGRFVASTEAIKFYYCVTDEAWKGLSVSNLMWSDDESFFKSRGLELHEPCQ